MRINEFLNGYRQRQEQARQTEETQNNEQILDQTTATTEIPQQESANPLVSE